MLVVVPLTYATVERDWAFDLPVGGEDVRAGTTNVYIVTFDAWTYRHTFPDGTLRPSLTNLAALVETATVYHDGHSPGTGTHSSILRFLYQPAPAFARYSTEGLEGMAFWNKPSFSGRSIFSGVPGNWFTCALGFWLRYDEVLANEVDAAARVENYAATRSFRDAYASLLLSQCAWLRHLGLPVKAPFNNDTVNYWRPWLYSQQQLPRLAVRVIEDVRQPTLAFFHLPFPHLPFAWTARGMKDPLPAGAVATEATLTNHLDNLAYLDVVVGRLVRALKRADKFENSLLILMGDHAWKYDPERSWRTPGDDVKAEARAEDTKPCSPLTHVPIIVKAPGQERRVDVYEPWFATNMYEQVIAPLLPGLND
jgi:hypothetical protein